MRDGNGYQCTMSQIRGPGGGNFQNKKTLHIQFYVLLYLGNNY